MLGGAPPVEPAPEGKVTIREAQVWGFASRFWRRAIPQLGMSFCCSVCSFGAWHLACSGDSSASERERLWLRHCMLAMNRLIAVGRTTLIETECQQTACTKVLGSILGLTGCISLPPAVPFGWRSLGAMLGLIGCIDLPPAIHVVGDL